MRLRGEVEHVRAAAGLAERANDAVDGVAVAEVAPVDGDPPAQVGDVVEGAARGRPHEGVDVRVQQHERVGQVGAHEAVRARDQHRPAGEVGAEVAPEGRHRVGGPQRVGSV